MIRTLCRSLCGAGIFAMAVVVMAGSLAQSSQAADKTPPVPFEKFYASERGDGKYLRFNAFSGEIPGKRIKALLRSGQVIGDRILLSEDVAVYFPDGYIVQSQTRFGKYMPRPGLIAGAVAKSDHLVKNPRYGLVAKFDQILGAECARTEYANGFAALRIKTDGVMSLVMETAGLYDPLVKEDTTTYTVTSAVQPVFIGNQGLLPDLMKMCGRG
ncbi:hypothetical protein [Thalassospira alkalitolerans]|uniref:hypothetical protein n=1 Tax=Thalassospira alkalitolerans TaxID=1293890 RepID=UPI0030EE577E|tara:strand:+ start:40602 stop:41243 length:642 start_codon:yes stop_codon:yes gene_type:complete